MAWCKLEDTFHGHPKFFQLAKRLGVRVAEARGLCAALWSWAIHHAPDGVLSGCEIEDIERIAGWEGDDGVCVKEMVALRVLDEVDGVLVIHDWMERAGSFLEARRQSKKRRRDRQKLEQKSHGTVTVQSRDSHGKVTTQSESESRVRVDLIHNSSSTPRDDAVSHEDQSRSVVEFFGVERQSSNIKQVFAHYRIYRPRSFRKPNSKTKEWSLVKARLSEGYSVEEICRAIDGCFASPWHGGQNDQKRKYQELELIVRSQAKLAQFLALADEHYNPARAPQHEKRSKELAELGIELGLGPPTPKELEKLLHLGISTDEIRDSASRLNDPVWGDILHV